MKQIENKTLLMRWIEEQNEGVSIEELLRVLYVEQGLSMHEVARKLNVNYHTIRSWLNQAEINSRLPHQKLLDMIDIKRKLEEK